MKKNILMINNPRSGMNKNNKELSDALEVFSNNGYCVNLMNTTKSGDATEYAKNFGGDYDMVVCRGGDGTFCETMNGIMELDKKPEIGFLPAGTTNDLAATLNLHTQAGKAAEMIMQETAKPCDIGTFNGRYFTYVASFGAFTRCAYATSQKLKNKIGRLAYFYGAAKDVKEIRSIPMRCTVDGVEITGNFMFGSISNARTVGKIIKLDESKACLNDGKYEVILAENPGTAKGWIELADSVFSKRLDHKCIKIFHASSVTIETIDGSPIPWTLDGEFAGNVDTVEIEITKHAFNMFRPAFSHEIEDADITVTK